MQPVEWFAPLQICGALKSDRADLTKHETGKI